MRSFGGNRDRRRRVQELLLLLAICAFLGSIWSPSEPLEPHAPEFSSKPRHRTTKQSVLPAHLDSNQAALAEIELRRAEWGEIEQRKAVLNPPIAAGGPEPTGLYRGQRSALALTIRGIAHGRSLAELRVSHGQGELRQVADSSRNSGRVAAWELDYGSYQATLDPSQIVGAVDGDGLERRGIPILARDDSAADVERLLGYPANSQAGLGGPPAWEWRYNYEGYGLTVSFLEQKVHSFHLEDRSMIRTG